jgi:type I restriction enzyme S subunit
LLEQARSYFKKLFVDDAKPEWKDGFLSDLGTIVAGGTPSKACPEYYTDIGIAWITPKDLSNDRSVFISHGEIDITDLGYAKSSATIMPKGSVLFSSRAPIGYIAIAANEVTTNQGFKSVVPNKNVGTGYMYFLLESLLPTIDNMASGSTFKEISGSAMKVVPVILPGDETLKQFNDFCEPLLNEIANLEQQSKLLASQRDSLLSKLMFSLPS